MDDTPPPPPPTRHPADSLVACAGQGTTIVACHEITDRLIAAERSEREGQHEAARELRQTAARFADVHLAELRENDGCGS